MIAAMSVIKKLKLSGALCKQALTRRQNFIEDRGMRTLCLIAIQIIICTGLDNGLVQTPPMGWLSSQRFKCVTDCISYPNDCITENLIKQQAHLMAIDGYLEAGYKYIGFGDCWMGMNRDEQGRLVPDKERFPNGMKYIADFIHDKGLKFALYEDYGSRTCGAYPGVRGHEAMDVKTFVEWDIDYLKLDSCFVEYAKDRVFPAVGKLLNESGRPIVFSCGWANYQKNPNYTAISKHCNLWRNWDDIKDSWQSLTTIMDEYIGRQDELVQYAGPGHWNDPDVLVIGNFGLSWNEARVQMAVWCIIAAPLFMSVDLATIRPEFKEILLNNEAIAVDQDPLGKQGRQVWRKNLCEIWNRELSNGAFALAFVSRREAGPPRLVTVSYDDMKIPQNTYEIKDIFNDETNIPTLSPGANFETRVNPSGVRFYKFTPTSTTIQS